MDGSGSKHSVIHKTHPFHGRMGAKSLTFRAINIDKQ